MASIIVKIHLLYKALEGYGTCTVSCTLNLRRNKPIAERFTFSDRLVQGFIGIQTQTITRFINSKVKGREYIMNRHDR